MVFGRAALLALLAGFSTAAAGTAEHQTRTTTPDASIYAPGMRLDPAGTPRALYRVHSRSYAGSPEDAARAFLREHADLLRIHAGASTLVTERAATAPGGSHIRFRQEYHGIPVLGADLVVSLGTDNRVGMVVNNAESTVSLPTLTPGLTGGRALDAARAALGITGRSIGKPDSFALVICRDSTGTWRLAYRILVTSEQPYGDWDIRVDAMDGRILQVEDLFVHHRGTLVQGTGMAYLQDPLTAARQMYGTPGFSDNSDEDSDSLSLYRTPVVLDSITEENGVYKLQGPFCTVTDIESPSDPAEFVAATPDGFSFTRSEQGFEAVNAYFHVSTSFQYLSSLGFSIPRLREIRIDPHGYQGQDNSHFSPSGNWISFGEGGVDDAEDADVIWHEYGHAIQYAIVPTWGGGECGALGEGISDYWAGSYGRSVGGWVPGDYHYDWLFNWDGHNTFWAGRILNDQRAYPFGAIPIHSAGQIVSSALMGIRSMLGREVTDRLVIKALYYLGSGVRAPDFAQALIQSDMDMYDGSHLSTLVYWLGTVKHFIDPQQYTSGVGEDDAVTGAFRLGRNYPNPFNPSTVIPFTLPERSWVRLEIFDVTGRLVATVAEGERPAGAQTATWNGCTDAGVPVGSGTYFYRLRSGSGGAQAQSATGSMLLLK